MTPKSVDEGSKGVPHGKTGKLRKVKTFLFEVTVYGRPFSKWKVPRGSEKVPKAFGMPKVQEMNSSSLVPRGFWHCLGSWRGLWRHAADVTCWAAVERVQNVWELEFQDGRLSWSQRAQAQVEQSPWKHGQTTDMKI